MQDDSPIILVVDDCIINRHLFRTCLANVGYQVEERGSGKECLEYCQSNPLPALIVLDVLMPGIDGVEVLEQLRKQHSFDTLPVIIVSGCNDRSDVTRGLKAGANDYVVKPFEAVSFLARVHNHVELGRMRRAFDEQRRALARVLEIQQTIGDVMLEGLLVQRPDGHLVYTNRPLRQMFGEERPTSLTDVLERLLGLEVSNELKRIILEQKGDHLKEFQTEVTSGTPTRRVYTVRSRLIRESSAEPLRLWSFRDVSELRELEKRVQLQIQLESVGQFVLGASHNFNNLLSAIVGSANLLRRWNQDNDNALKCINNIERCVASGARFTQKLTSMLKTQRAIGGKSGEDIREVITVITEAMRLSVGDRISFIIDAERGIPLVGIDLHNLGDLFGNILSNSVDAIEDQGVITVSIRYSHQESRVRVNVEDSGCGMDEETMRKVCDPFFSTKTLDLRHGVSCEGRGLGMWNVYNLARSFGGTVAVSSEKGRGTKVAIELPITPKDRVEGNAPMG